MKYILILLLALALGACAAHQTCPTYAQVNDRNAHI